MCIEQPIEWRTFSCRNNVSIPDVTDKRTVVKVINNKNGKPGYVLAEHDGRIWFAPECFAILPDQSAEEMQQLEREGIVNLEIV